LVLSAPIFDEETAEEFASYIYRGPAEGRHLVKNQILQSRMKKLFTEAFTALEIAEPLLSFDNDKNSEHVKQAIGAKNQTVAGVRIDGVVAGFVLLEDLSAGTCGEHIQTFSNNVTTETASFPEVIDILSGSDYCFVSVLDSVSAVITKNDFQKPAVRMWLFGMISIVEIFISRVIKEKYPGSSWQDLIPEGRLKAAKELQAERKRAGQDLNLLDCLHLADKAGILIKDPEMREDFGFESRKDAKKSAWEFMSLRNSLAHAHDIVTYDWDMIVNMSKRLDKIMTRI
jgi:hypothetical protein